MTVADDAVASDEDVESVRRWVGLSCTEPGTHLPALVTIALQLQLSTAVVRAALERLATEGLVTLHGGYRLYSVGAMSPMGRVVCSRLPAGPVRVTWWMRPSSAAIFGQACSVRRSATRISSRASQHSRT
ncbi:GntR family transcriptional regulator [Streptomyces sp. NPDC001435]|uniref:GntR family transcriptional regulator n=1 Tax=unclassified Streptomyces TaxID=2593676 RepID=UPI00368E2387